MLNLEIKTAMSEQSSLDLLKFWVLSFVLKNYRNIEKVKYMFYGAMCLILLRKAKCMIKYVLYRYDWWEDIKSEAVKMARKLPFAKEAIAAELEKSVVEVEKSVLKKSYSPSFPTLPDDGVTSASLKTLLAERAELERDEWKGGRLSGTVYYSGEELASLQKEALGLYALSNLLHADVFTCTRQMEAEVISMVLGLFKGGEGAGGSVTSGGTESLLLAVKAYRDWARAEKGIHEPNMVIPHSAHAAFWKAEQYLGVEMRKAPLTSEGEVDVAAVKRLMDGNTIALVGSAPNYPHGTMDPLEALGALAKSRGVGLHVDACLGGFVIAFAEPSKKGKTLPYRFDFSVEGVTTISVDTHKYGFSCKGSSLLLYRSTSLRRFQYSFCSDWPGGIYGTPTVCGSRAAAPTIACWTTLLYMGRKGYKKCANDILNATRIVAEGVRSIPQLDILGRPDVSVVAFTFKKSIKMNIYELADVLSSQTEKKWQLNMLQKPAGLHLALTVLNSHLAAIFVSDLKAGIQIMEEKCKRGGGQELEEGAAAMYGAAAQVPRALCEEVVSAYLDACYQLKRDE